MAAWTLHPNTKHCTEPFHPFLLLVLADLVWCLWNLIYIYTPFQLVSGQRSSRQQLSTINLLGNFFIKDQLGNCMPCTLWSDNASSDIQIYNGPWCVMITKKSRNINLCWLSTSLIKVRLLFFVAACNWDGGQTFASNVVHLDPSVFFKQTLKRSRYREKFRWRRTTIIHFSPQVNHVEAMFAVLT